MDNALADLGLSLSRCLPPLLLSMLFNQRSKDIKIKEEADFDRPSLSFGEGRGGRTKGKNP